MATAQFISPMVSITENDLTFLPQGIAEIGAAFIGPTSFGPAFVPTIVSSPQDFNNIFGGVAFPIYTTYAVNDYLNVASQAVVVRVLGLTGYDSSINKSAIVFISGSGGKWPLAVLNPTQNAITLASVSASGTPTNFTLYLSGSDQSVTASGLSVVGTSSAYITNYFGTTPSGKFEAYVGLQFPAAINFVSGSALGTGSIVVEDSAGRLNFSGSVYGTYNHATTPVIRSQTVGGTRYNLFTVSTFCDGTNANEFVKISIANIRPDPLGLKFGTFTLLVRDFNDTDTNLSILEQYDNLTLDSTSTDYIARRIGSSKPVIDFTSGDVYFDGDFPNLSKFIYVTMDSGIANVPVAANPHGFSAISTPLQVVNMGGLPTGSYVNTRYSIPAGSSVSVPNNNVFYGFNFSDLNGLSYLSPLPSGSTSNGIGFNLENVIDTDVSGSLTSVAGLPYRKFTVPMQGGFDGLLPWRVIGAGSTLSSTNMQGFDLSTSTSPGTVAYQQAINSLSNPDALDINLLLIPGVNYEQHAYVASLAMSMCQSRGDVFYIMDEASIDQTVTGAVADVQGIDSNYVGCYYPWVKILDISTNQNVWVPPSTVMARTYAFNDQVGAEWFAPAGFQRGGIGTVLQVRKRLAQADRDNLYLGRVNPIATFPGQGFVAWGQKTLQQENTALTRINVRRLLINLKKFVASSGRFILFQQNTQDTRNQFLNMINPYLASVQERQGLYSFKVISDDSNNTPDMIDRNILVADIFIQPTRTAEFIKVTFNIEPTGATVTGG